MSSGKKGKKKKGVTVDLWSFLADGKSNPNVPLKTSSWADDVEDDHDGFSSRSNKDPVILPTAPRAARGPGIDEENIPTNPPYVAYISNLPYDIDESDLVDFFTDMKISNMRLPKDANKSRGYGYVEFEDRQSLIDALSMTNTTIKSRRVRIEVSNNSNDERRGGRMGRDSRRDNYDDPERTSGDWRSGPREELLDGDNYRSRYDNRDRRDDRERYDYDNKPGAWRERDSSDKGSTFKDRGGFRDDDKDRDRDWNRYGDRESRDRDGGSSFGPRRNYGDSGWERDRAQDRSNSDAKPEPRTRPKLQLQPRTKPVEPIVVAEEETTQSSTESKSAKAQSGTASSTQQQAPATNIFGAAKPVDTTAREREIEERLAKSYAESRSREETDNKERSSKDSTWGRRNGEGRDDKDKDKDRERGRPAWRSEEDRGSRVERSAPRSQVATARSEQQNEASSTSRSGSAVAKGSQKPSEKDARAPERDRKDKEKDEVNRMPKAKDEQAPNFVASNKYSMLPDDVDPDNIDD
ncbi:eukaryotic translation initiation factor 4B-like [Odontomachus brunneus]|uniref:eukaryotic translation initiation factor 4B-like n=1 Tax=Odontomachus brunneus TaxID=486640 RepID=UPI0013F25FC6|nr:eukaryotic translation initiation factor 4B-like [Odontomachus brunneus]